MLTFNIKPMAGSAAAALILLLAAPAGLGWAQGKPKSLGTFSDWDAFVLGDGKARTCYVVSRPKSSEPKGARRGDIYVLISHRPADQVRNEVSINAGYPYRKNSSVEAQVGSEKFELVTFDKTGYEDTAWAPDTGVDQSLVEAMMRGSTMTVKGTSERGTQTADSYSLSGVTAALKAIGEACK